MPRARVEPGRAALCLTAAKSDASPSLRATILSIVVDLEGQDLNGLRRQWRAHLGGEPPAHFPRWLLMRVLAFRLQSDAGLRLTRCRGTSGYSGFRQLRV
jgi:hypothetical protein